MLKILYPWIRDDLFLTSSVLIDSEKGGREREGKKKQEDGLGKNFRLFKKSLGGKNKVIKICSDAAQIFVKILLQVSFVTCPQ